VFYFKENPKFVFNLKNSVNVCGENPSSKPEGFKGYFLSESVLISNFTISHISLIVGEAGELSRKKNPAVEKSQEISTRGRGHVFEFKPSAVASGGYF